MCALRHVGNVNARCDAHMHAWSTIVPCQCSDEIASDVSRLSITPWKEALNKHHQELRTGILVHNFLPDLKGLPLTDTEYAQICDKAGNVFQVDELIEILRTKTRAHFDKFCSVLEENGYQHWARRLKGEGNGCQG